MGTLHPPDEEEWFDVDGMNETRAQSIIVSTLEGDGREGHLATSRASRAAKGRVPLVEWCGNGEWLGVGVGGLCLDLCEAGQFARGMLERLDELPTLVITAGGVRCSA